MTSRASRITQSYFSSKQKLQVHVISLIIDSLHPSKMQCTLVMANYALLVPQYPSSYKF